MKKFINWIILFVKGAIMGIGNVIPGVSGGTLAVILGIYDKFISSLSHIFKKFKESILFLIPVALGMVFAIIFSSKVIGDAFEYFPLATALLFEGMILGGIPILYKKIDGHVKKPSNILIFVIVAGALLAYTFLANTDNVVNITTFGLGEYLILFVMGIISAATMIIPGISGSMTLMVFGYYELIVSETIGNILDFSKFGYHMQILIPFGIGCVVGIILVSKLIEFLLKRFETKTYFAIFGFLFASLIIIIVLNLPAVFNIVELIVGLLLLVIGFFISYFISIGKVKIGKFEPFKKKEKNAEN